MFVEQKVYDEFTERVGKFGNGLRVGNGLDPELKLGRWSPSSSCSA